VSESLPRASAPSARVESGATSSNSPAPTRASGSASSSGNRDPTGRGRRRPLRLRSGHGRGGGEGSGSQFEKMKKGHQNKARSTWSWPVTVNIPVTNTTDQSMTCKLTHAIDTPGKDVTVGPGETVTFESNTQNATVLNCYPEAPAGGNPASGVVQTTVGCWSSGGPTTCHVTACPETNKYSPTDGRCYDPGTNWSLNVEASCAPNVSANPYPITISDKSGCVK